MTPDRLPHTSEHDSEWIRILNERPILGQLQTGKHVRNQQEIDDTWEFIDEFSARFYQPEYIAIGGSRQAEKVYWSEEKLVNSWKHSININSLAYLYKEILRSDKDFDGRKIPPIQEYHQLDADSLPRLNEFYYDIDIILVQNVDKRPLNVKRRIGKRSGSLIEIYSISRRVLFDNLFPEIQEYFYNSQRILRY